MKQQHLFLFLIISMHLAGIIGLQTSWQWLFQWFTPFHILAMAGILLWPDRADRRCLAAAGAVALATWLIEAIGVNTGLIFGAYTYGHTLGIQVAGTPLLIGVNWVLLSFAIGHLLGNFPEHPLVKAALAATLMVGTDVLIEPVAMAFDLWDWQDGNIPHQNYLGWWMVSFVLFAGLFQWVRFPRNVYAAWILIAQILFFLTLGSLL